MKYMDLFIVKGDINDRYGNYSIFTLPEDRKCE